MLNVLIKKQINTDYSNLLLSELSNSFNSNYVITEDSLNCELKIMKMCLVNMAGNDSKCHVKKS